MANINNDNPYNFVSDLWVTVVSPDPLFQLAHQGLIGRDRFTRIHQIYDGLNLLISDLETDAFHMSPSDPHVVIIDCGYLGVSHSLISSLELLRDYRPHVKTVAYVDTDNWDNHKHFFDNLDDLDCLDSLFLKHELGPCSHLVAQACYQTEKFLTNNTIFRHIKAHGTRRMCVPLPSVQKWERDMAKLARLTQRQTEVFVLRAFAGLDNSDIIDELVITESTVKRHLGKIFESLNASKVMPSEKTYAVFRELSEWWWRERFLPFL